MNQPMDTPPVRLGPWSARASALLQALNAPAMTEYHGGPEANAICRKVGFTLRGECDFEYPPGHEIRCDDWRFDLTLAW